MNNVEIDKLNETLKEYADYATKLVKENKRKDKEIERLSKEVTKYDEILCERNNEVDRLYNIIDELEMYLKRKVEETIGNKAKYYDRVLRELYKLKEGVNNENNNI